MSSRKRLIVGFWATALGPFVTLLVQLVSVPLFLHYWGSHRYGEWLIMSAVPMYLSISDIGFGTVAGNDMAMRVSAGDYSGALETFQSTWALVAGLSLAIAALAFCCIFMTPLTSWLRIQTVPVPQARLVLAALSVYALGVLQASTLLSGFRSDGKYPLGAFATNLVRLAENAAALATLMFHGGPVRVALVMAAIRLTGTAAVAAVLTVSLRWIRFGSSHASWQRVKTLARPAFAFMAFPIGNALSIQGMTVLLGMLLGPVAVATFTPMRTLSRFPYQVIDSIKNAVWPELSSAYGAQKWELARRLHRSCCQIAFWFALIAVLGLAIAGPACFHMWTRGQVVMNQTCFYVLLTVVVASSLWNTSSAVSVAANRHQQLAVQYLLGTAGSLLLGYLLVQRFGLTGAAVALLACDLWMGSFVVRASNKLLGDHTPDFVRSMVQVQRLWQLWARPGRTG
jgi:O-antigen/teichoic acid export membrane protein